MTLWCTGTLNPAWVWTIYSISDICRT